MSPKKDLAPFSYKEYIKEYMTPKTPKPTTTSEKRSDLAAALEEEKRQIAATFAAQQQSKPVNGTEPAASNTQTAERTSAPITRNKDATKVTITKEKAIDTPALERKKPVRGMSLAEYTARTKARKVGSEKTPATTTAPLEKRKRTETDANEHEPTTKKPKLDTTEMLQPDVLVPQKSAQSKHSHITTETGPVQKPLTPAKAIEATTTRREPAPRGEPAPAKSQQPLQTTTANGSKPKSLTPAKKIGGTTPQRESRNGDFASKKRIREEDAEQEMFSSKKQKIGQEATADTNTSPDSSELSSGSGSSKRATDCAPGTKGKGMKQGMRGVAQTKTKAKKSRRNDMDDFIV